MMHVMVVMMPMMVVMMKMVVMMMMLHGSRSGRRSGFLCDGVPGEAERERGRNDKGLDHETTSFC